MLRNLTTKLNVERIAMKKEAASKRKYIDVCFYMTTADLRSPKKYSEFLRQLLLFGQYFFEHFWRIEDGSHHLNFRILLS